MVFALALPLRAGNDISFDPRITQTDFHTFSLLVAQGIYADPVQPARASGIAGFDLGVAATLVQVDRNATYWQRSVGSDFSTSGFVALPRIVVSKGFRAGTLSLSYARLSNTGIATVGGALDFPLINGGVARPTLAIRIAYSSLNGVSVYRLRTYGGELFLSKGFGPVVAYIAAGPTRIDARGTIVKTLTNPEITLTDTGNAMRYSAGVRLSMFLPKIGVEATQGRRRSYAAKVSFGF